MQIELIAYAEDCVLTGTLELVGPRLTDLLTATGELDLVDVRATSLSDGHVALIDALTVRREELCAVTAAGPRGDGTRRIRTRTHPKTIRVGPYEIVGCLHAAPTADPLAVAVRRPVVPVTMVRISLFEPYGDLGLHDALLVNRERIDWIGPATDQDLGLAKSLELPIHLDPRAKDRTGELYA